MRYSSLAVLVVIGALAVAAVIFGMADLIVLAGRYIVSDDLLLDYSLGVIWAIGLGLSILFWPVPKGDKKPLLLGWLAKCIVMLGFMLYYEYSYDTDSFGYFFASSRSDFAWNLWEFGNGTRNFFQLLCLHSGIFPDSYHWMKVSCSLLGFLGVYLCYRAAMLFLAKNDTRVFLVLALYPSNLFWSSIISKDPVTLFFIGLYTFGVASWYSTGRFVYLIPSLIAAWGVMWFRYWLGPILIAPMAVFLFARLRGTSSKLILAGVVAVAFFFAVGRSNERLNIQTTQDIVETSDKYVKGGWAGGSAATEQVSFSSPMQVIAYWPYGTFTALFRPLPGEVKNAFGTLAGIENLALLVLLLRAIRRTRLKDLMDPRVLWALGLIMTWSTVYGLISAQNLGSAVRFKLQILPILLCVLLYLSRSRGAGTGRETTLLPELARQA